MPPVRVSVLALRGALDSGLAVTLDVFAAANRIATESGTPRPFVVRVLSTGPAPITTSCGSVVHVDGPARRAGLADVVLAPGINVPTAAEIEAALKRADVRAAGRFLARAHARGALVCVSCSATFVLAESGLLDGRDATTSWFLAPLFRQRYPAVRLRSDATLTCDGRIVCGGAALSQVDVALFVVRRFAGPEMADLVSRYLVVDERPSQARYFVLDHLARSSPEVSRAERFIRNNLASPISMAAVARAAGASSRTLARRFHRALGEGPLRFVQRLRVERALHLLETTTLSVEEVAWRVGYRDPVALRRLIRRETGTSARALRAARRSPP